MSARLLDRRVGIVPKKETPAFGTYLRNGQKPKKILDLCLREALERHWQFPALLTCYTVDGEPSPYRLKTADEPWVKERGGEVRLPFMAFDYDLRTPDGQKRQWTDSVEAADFLAKLFDAVSIPDLSAFYTTKHGARMIYELSRPLSTDEFERAYQTMLAKLRAVGIESDENTADWTRLFTLPYVTKENGEQLWDLGYVFHELFPDAGLVDVDTLLVGPSSKSGAEGAPFSGEKPSDDDALALVEAHRPMVEQLCVMTGADPLLEVIRNPQAVDVGVGKRDTTLWRLLAVGSNRLHRVTQGSPELLYALLLPIAHSLTEQDSEGHDWTELLWENVCRIWAGDEVVELGSETLTPEDEDTESGSTPLKEAALRVALAHPSREFPSNDRANARILIKCAGDHIRHVRDSGTLASYDNTQGLWDLKGEDRVFAKSVAVEYYWRCQVREHQDLVERLRAEGAEEGIIEAAELELKRCAGQATKTGNKKTRQDIIHSIKGEPGMTVLSSKFDADADLLNTPEGVVRLSSGEVLPHSPDLYLAKMTSAAFDPSATAPKFLAFVEWMFPNVEVREFVQRALGSTLFGFRANQRVFVFHGNGRNGKSTLLDLIVSTLGDYGYVAPQGFLLKSTNQDFETVKLRGRRLALVSENDRDAVIDAARLKYLTGDAEHTGAAKYEQSITWQANADIVVLTNNPPIIHDDSYGMWRRILLIPCTQTAENEDASLPAKLAEESSGILNWMLKGYASFRSEGLNPPASVVEASDRYRTESDPVRQFISEKLEPRVDSEVRTLLVHGAYLDWCRQVDRKALSRNPFSSRLKAILGEDSIAPRGGGYSSLLGYRLTHQERAEGPGIYQLHKGGQSA